ncbi:MAG: hypothetical protein DLM62_07530, partial [Pseudonocardiales bacterium]
IRVNNPQGVSPLTAKIRYFSAMTSSAAAITHLVAALVTDEVSLSELGQAGDVFRAANGAARATSPVYEVVVCAPVLGSVRSREGYDLQVPGGLDTVMRADTVLLPGCWPVDVPPEPDVLDAVRTAHSHGARIVATCTGVSVAAAAGLLDGRTATTHWRHAEIFARAHPRVLLQPDVLYLDHGDVATSAGTSAGLDLYLHLVRRDHGAEVAAAVARRLISPRQRDGGQPQLLPDPQPQRQDELTALLEVSHGAPARSGTGRRGGEAHGAERTHPAPPLP